MCVSKVALKKNKPKGLVLIRCKSWSHKKWNMPDQESEFLKFLFWWFDSGPMYIFCSRITGTSIDIFGSLLSKKMVQSILMILPRAPWLPYKSIGCRQERSKSLRRFESWHLSKISSVGHTLYVSACNVPEEVWHHDRWHRYGIKIQKRSSSPSLPLEVLSLDSWRTNGGSGLYPAHTGQWFTWPFSGETRDPTSVLMYCPL